MGLGLIASSVLPDPGIDDAWMRDLLMTVGSAVALFAPFYWFGRSLDAHLEEVEERTSRKVEQVRNEAAESTSALADQVEALRSDLDQTISDVAAEVEARLAATAAAHEEAFAAIRVAPTRDALWEALERADRMHLTTPRHPPRVRIEGSSPRLYVSFAIDTDGTWSEEPLELRIEAISGRVLETVPWPDAVPAVDVLTELGERLTRHDSARLDVAALFGGLADLLETALVHHDHRPAIELCPPQWLVCDWGVVSPEQMSYGVNLKGLRAQHEHVSGKPWIDFNSWDRAYEVALELFPFETGAQPGPWGTQDDAPPF